ncbi:putative formin-like protein 5 [Iris pallida]|uniref:Formin-like protein 5 n=1 Tax=Iris pallida TaxID=29817 RepID=A0AAX6DK74_IRIPA|nr:putative formin-like protein 5 [Iris pallida]
MRRGGARRCPWGRQLLMLWWRPAEPTEDPAKLASGQGRDRRCGRPGGTFGDFDRTGREPRQSAAVALKGTAKGASGLGMMTLARWRSRRGRDGSAPYGAELRRQRGWAGCRGPIHGAGGWTFEIERVAALAWRRPTLGARLG